jgi:hypothetical protein
MMAAAQRKRPLSTVVSASQRVCEGVERIDEGVPRLVPNGRLPQMMPVRPAIAAR